MTSDREVAKGPEAAIEDLLDLERGALTQERFMQAMSNAWAAGMDHAMRLVEEGVRPDWWWNGFMDDGDELHGASFSPVEDTWHDIPLYCGVNPSRRVDRE